MKSPNAPAPLRSAIGDALVKAGAITQEQLTRALRVQALLEDPKQLVEVLVELGYGTRQSLNETITSQGSSLRLGDLLVEQGLITVDTLAMALETQKEQGVRLGEALLNLGAINERTLLRNVAHQSGVPYIEELVIPRFELDAEGLLKVPTGPGLGIELNPDALGKYARR